MFVSLGLLQPAYAATPTPVMAAAETTGPCSNLTQCSLIYSYVDPFIDFLAALVGVAVVVSIVIGGIQYSSSAGDPGKASAAKNRIRNAIIALVTFLLLYAMLNFLIPGGLI
jgi:hypothetical protein